MMVNQQKILAEAAQARALRGDPLLTKFFTQIRKDIQDQWQQTDIKDMQSREQLYFLARAVNRLEDSLNETIAAGQYVSYDVRQEHEFK